MASPNELFDDVLSTHAYGRHRAERGLRGTSHVAVLEAIKYGRLTEPAVQKVGARWKIDPELADEQWRLNTNAAQVRGKPDKLPKELPPPPKTGRQPHDPSKGPSMAEAQRALAVYKAERERLALMKEKGEMVMEADVSRRWFEHSRAIRDGFMSIPDRIASQLAACKDATEAHQLLTAEITGVLRVLADG